MDLEIQNFYYHCLSDILQMWIIPELTETKNISHVRISPYLKEKSISYKLKLFMLQLGKGPGNVESQIYLREKIKNKDSTMDILICKSKFLE